MKGGPRGKLVLARNGKYVGQPHGGGISESMGDKQNQKMWRWLLWQNCTISLSQWFNHTTTGFCPTISCLPFIELTEIAKGNLGNSAVYVHTETWPIGPAVFAKSQAAPIHFTHRGYQHKSLFLTPTVPVVIRFVELSWFNRCRRLSKKTLQLGAWTTM